MKDSLGGIQSGSLAEAFLLEDESGGISFNALRRQGRGHPMKEVGARWRVPMPWLGKSHRVDRSNH